MTSLSEIEAAAAALSLDEQKKLFDWLALQIDQKREPKAAHSVLEIPSVSLGAILERLTDDDDLLDEMMEGRF